MQGKGYVIIGSDGVGQAMAWHVITKTKVYSKKKIFASYFIEFKSRGGK